MSGIKHYRRLTLHSQHELKALRRALARYNNKPNNAKEAHTQYLEDMDYVDTIKTLGERANRVRNFKVGGYT